VSRFVALFTTVLVAAFAATTPTAADPTSWSDGVTQICANALLFEGQHEIGTRAGAIAVARDIRASTARLKASASGVPGACACWMKSDSDR
jgi:hypothetical protein